jgi:hypothetical protein
MDDDTSFPDFLDAPETDSDPTARGIVQCLRMLAEEAASLGLGRTLDALQTAISVCAAESDAAEGEESGEGVRPRATGSARLH